MHLAGQSRLRYDIAFTTKLKAVLDMQQRILGKTGLSVSILGFGCMRLPLTDPKNPASIDYDVATRMLRKAVDGGVNYVDTAWPYHGNKGNRFPGESEPFTAHALKDGYREKVYLATKLPTWAVTTRADMDRFLDEQLKRLDTPYIDCYLAHNMNSAAWPRLKNLGLADFFDAALKDGRIRHAGFSFHDSLPLFEDIVNGYDWSFGQIQYNYLDVNHQAGEKGLRLMAGKGMGAVIMEPLRGGFLINTITDEMRAIFGAANPSWSLADWALRWLWSQGEVNLVLSGMSTLEQVEENLRIANAAGTLNDGELAAAADVRGIFHRNLRLDCTGCGYCMPCPFGVNIPKNLNYYNNYHLVPTEANHARFLTSYRNQMTAEESYANCTQCGACEAKCPQHLPIAETMPKLAEDFGGQQ